MVEYLSHHPKVKGSRLATITGNVGEKFYQTVGQHSGKILVSSTQGQRFKSSHHYWQFRRENVLDTWMAQWQNTCLVILRSKVHFQPLPLAMFERKYWVLQNRQHSGRILVSSSQCQRFKSSQRYWQCRRENVFRSLGGTVVEHLSHHPKVNGSSRATTAGNV